LKGIDEIYAAKGKKVVHVNLKTNRPDDDELVKLMLGPTGNLRAPTLQQGKTLVIGFNSELYSEIFG
jgi:arsenate reductase-like glutaredoxin family protein